MPGPLPGSAGWVDDGPINILHAAMAAQTALYYAGETAVSFQVPAKLTAPDPLIAAAEKTLQDDRQLYWTKGMVRAGNGMALRASKGNINRALWIMDTLVKRWRARGYQIGFRDKETVVRIREVDLKVGLRELTKKLPNAREQDAQRNEATGQLAFKLNAWVDREWRDGKTALEDQCWIS